MKFEIHRKLENKVFSTVIKFKEYGGKDIEAEEEKVLLNDFGAPKINLGKIDFSGKVSKDEDGKLKVSEDGEELSLVFNAKTILIDENFLTSFVIDPKNVNSVEVKEVKEGNKVLVDNQAIAEAACLLFENKIQETLEEKIEELKKLYTEFEKESPIEFTI